MKVLISGSYNVFNEGWNGCGVYMASGNYISETFKQPIYLGSSADLQQRVENEHIGPLNRNRHENNPFQYSWNKHSEKEGFIWFLVETCEPEKCKETEQKYLDLYKPFLSNFGGFNIAENAGGFEKGHIPWNKGKTGLQVAWNKGKPFSLESREKMSQAHKGQWLGDNNPARKNPKTGSKNPFFGKSLSKESIEKMLISKKDDLKSIKCIETGIIYRSLTDASKALNLTKGAISHVINGRSKTCGGFHWELVNPK